MSHVVKMDLRIESLDALADACKTLGLELVLGQKTYKWFGRFVGDSPMPEGFTREELGKCLHAIRIPGHKEAYEIGVVNRKDGVPGFTLLWDFWAGGYGMQAAVGKNGGLMKQAYFIARAKKEALRKGYRTTQVVRKPNGNLQLEAF